MWGLCRAGGLGGSPQRNQGGEEHSGTIEGPRKLESPSVPDRGLATLLARCPLHPRLCSFVGAWPAAEALLSLEKGLLWAVQHREHMRWGSQDTPVLRKILPFLWTDAAQCQGAWLGQGRVGRISVPTCPLNWAPFGIAQPHNHVGNAACSSLSVFEHTVSPLGVLSF